MIENIMFREDRDDGSVRLYALEPWPRHTAISGEILKRSSSKYIRQIADVVGVRCDNGDAYYKLINYDEQTDVYEAQLVDSMWEPPPL
jgi:hypothetical protein